MYSADVLIAERKKQWELRKDINFDKTFINAVVDNLKTNTALQEEIIAYPEKLIELFFYIVDKDKATVPFFLNNVQIDFIKRFNIALEEYNAGTRNNLSFAVLKGRQQGFTSLFTAYQLACTITRKNFEGFTVADENDNATAIFQNKAKFVLNSLHQAIKPTEKYNNKKQLLFEKINSSWEVATAPPNMGRSRTINFVHFSEVAFFKECLSSIQAGLGQALTKSAIQIYESTANGYNEFKELWDSKKCENCFYEWWHTAEYVTNFETETKRIEFVNNVKNSQEWIYKRCKWLLEEIKLTKNQTYWYYCKYKSYLNGELVKQEYPCTPDEAFLSSGSCVFNSQKVNDRLAYLINLYKDKPYQEGYFTFEWNDPERQDYIKDDTIKFIESKTNPLIRIYHQSEINVPYVLGGDTKGEGSDRYTATVIDNNNSMRCATLQMEVNHSRPYISQVYCLAKMYNTALIAIENNKNTAPIETLEQWQYPKQYIRERWDTYKSSYYKAHGFVTDGSTRLNMIEKEIELVENNIDLFFDIDTLREMLTFIYDKNNRPDAMAGKHDDLLFSDMICNMTRHQQTTNIIALQIDKTPQQKHKEQLYKKMKNRKRFV